MTLEPDDPTAAADRRPHLAPLPVATPCPAARIDGRADLPAARRILAGPLRILALGVLAVGAGGFLAPRTLPARAAEASPYQAALAEARKDPARADFDKLRELYTQDRNYLPYVHLTPPYREHHPALFEALDAGDFKSAIKHAEAILDVDYLDTEAHFFSAKAYEALGKRKPAEFHRRFFEGVMNSILSTGDGAGPQTAIRVITVTEEWAVLSRLGYPPGGKHATEIHDGVLYDVLSGTHVQTGEEKTFYFRPVDAFWKDTP